MAVTPQDIRDAREEFASLLDAQMQPKIDEATRRCHGSNLGEGLDDAVLWLACHLIFNSPMGASSALGVAGADGSTPYLEEWKRIVRPRCAGPWLGS